MNTFQEQEEKLFEEKFGNPTAKYLGNDFAEYPKANIKDALDFLRLHDSRLIDYLLEKMKALVVDDAGCKNHNGVLECCRNETLDDTRKLLEDYKK